jgi:rhodanese-related sulfurtransferase
MREFPPWIVTADELRTELESASGRPVLLDVREPEEWAEARLEGAVLIPLGEVLERAPKELRPGDDIVIYCAHGVRSLHALRALQLLGFSRLRSLHGGLAAWLGDPSF